MVGITDSPGGVQWKRLLALLGIYVFGNLLALGLTYLFAYQEWLELAIYTVPVMFAAVPLMIWILGRRGATSPKGSDTRGWATALYVVAIITWVAVMWAWWENARYFFLG